MADPADDNRAEHERLMVLIRRHPGCTRSELSELSGVPTPEIGRILGDEVRRLVMPQRRTSHVSDDQILGFIRAGAERAGEPLTHTGYDAVRDQFGGLSAVRIIQRFGAWSIACQAAGVTTLKPARSNYTRRWDRDTMLERVADYLQSPGASGTYLGYSRWASATAEAPSAQTVRNTIGSWRTVKTGALVVVSERERNPEVSSQG